MKSKICTWRALEGLESRNLYSATMFDTTNIETLTDMDSATNTRGIISADFNKDGYLDLVIANGEDNVDTDH